MLYATLKIGEQEYKGRLNARNCVALEQKLGRNPLTIFTSLEGNALPSLSDLLTVLQFALTELNHNVNADTVYDIYDKFCDEGGNIVALINYLLEVFKVSGFIPEDDTKNKRKN